MLALIKHMKSINSGLILNQPLIEAYTLIDFHISYIAIWLYNL